MPAIPVNDIAALSREERCALLAEAEPARLIKLADTCLADGADLEIVVSPEVGCVSTQIREPIMRERFLIGDVLACRAEVDFAGVRGWAMRLGEDRAATLAAAVLDACAESGSQQATAVDALCRETAQRIAAEDREEWAQLAPTIVQFEELL